MGPPAVRFRPPRVAMDPEIRWMLARAFGPVGPVGPVGMDAPAGIDAAAALVLARRFEVAPRIAARHGRERLAAELGGEAAAGLARDRATAAALELRLSEVAAEVAAEAAALGVPLVFLKFMALQLAGRLAPGARPACDVDVLVPAAAARPLAAALGARGFRSAAVPPEEHQLPALAHPDGGVVEIHVHVPGIRPGPGRAAATVEDLARLGLLRPAPGMPGACSLPVPELLAAHALVHALAQHGGAPGAYSLLKAVGDLIDLGFPGPDAGAALAGRIGPWVARDLAPAEVAAALALCGALARGEEVEEESPAGLLLRHGLAGRLDARYARALKLSLFRAQPSELPAPARLARSLWRAVVLTRDQVDAIYGPPAEGEPGRAGWRRELAYVGRRLWRPLDLLGRLASYGASSLAASRGLSRLSREPGEGARHR